MENTTLPMGDYVIERAHPDRMSPMVVRSKDGKTSVAFLCVEASNRKEMPTAESELVFEEVGGKTFLHEIWFADEQSGMELVKSRTFTEAMRSAEGSGVHKSVKASHAT